MVVADLAYFWHLNSLFVASNTTQEVSWTSSLVRESQTEKRLVSFTPTLNIHSGRCAEIQFRAIRTTEVWLSLPLLFDTHCTVVIMIIVVQPLGTIRTACKWLRSGWISPLDLSKLGSWHWSCLPPAIHFDDRSVDQHWLCCLLAATSYNRMLCGLALSQIK